MLRDLGNEVRRRSESIDAEPSRIASHPQAAMADQSRAKERSGLDVRVAIRERKAVPLAGNGHFGITTVQVIAGKARAIAKVIKI